jgi:hypothetical protein
MIRTQYLRQSKDVLPKLLGKCPIPIVKVHRISLIKHFTRADLSRTLRQDFLDKSGMG